MQSPSRAVIRAGLSMLGTIIGAGIFGIPAVMSELGLGVGSLIFWMVAGVALTTHLLFVDMITCDRVKRRLPGYVGVVLGTNARYVALGTHSFQLLGAGLAYCILGGQFLYILASRLGAPFSLFEWQFIFWAASSLLVIWGISIVARVESLLSWMLVVFVAIFIILLLPITSFSPMAWKISPGANVLGSLGIFLFALSGFSVVPEIHDMTGRVARLTRWSVVIGSLSAAFLTWSFGVTVHLAAPQGLHGDFIGTMANLLPQAFWWLLPLVGFLAVITSFITSAYALHSTYRLDFRQTSFLSWAIALGVPLLLLFLTQRNFLGTIGIVGAVFTAANALFITFCAYFYMSRYPFDRPFWWRILVPFVTGGMFGLSLLHRYMLIFV